MPCWLTTHYPHYPPEYCEPSLEVWSIFVPRRHRAALERLSEGERVAFYTVKHGPRVTGRPRRPQGEQAVVCLSRVAGPVEQCPLHEKYADGRTGDYAWQRRCREHVFGRLDRVELCDIMGWSRDYYLHGLGGGSGLIEVPATHFNAIDREFARGS